jgi:hypothetical protein
MNYKQSLIAIFMVLMTAHLTAQSKTDPTWYTMMRDPKVNYYKVVEAIDRYRCCPSLYRNMVKSHFCGAMLCFYYKLINY